MARRVSCTPLRGRLRARFILIPALGISAVAPPHQPATALSSGCLAEARQLLRATRIPDAEAQASTCLAEVERSAGVDSLAAAEAIDLILEARIAGWSHATQGSLDLAERAVRIKRRDLAPEDPGLATSLMGLGEVLRALGSAAPAVTIVEEALAIRKRQLGPAHPEVASSLRALANAQVELGAYADAEANYLGALGIALDQPGGSPSDVGPLKYNLARLKRRSGDFDAAGRLYKEAIEAIRASEGASSPRYAVGLTGYAVFLEETGDLARSLEVYEEACRIAVEVHGSEHASVARCLNNQGMLHRRLNDLDEAERLYRESLHTGENVWGPDHPETLTTLRNMGEVRFLRGELAEAEAIFLRVLEARAAMAGLEPMMLGDSHLDLAKVREAMAGENADRLGPALEHYERAASLYLEGGGRGPHYARALVGLAAVQERIGLLEAARANYLASSEIDARTLGDHPDTAESLLRYAGFLLRRGEEAEALDVALKAEEVWRSHFLLTASGLAEEDSLQFGSRAETGLALALSMSAGDADPMRVWDATIRSRAIVLDEMAHRQGLLGRDATPEVRALAEEYRRASRKLSMMVTRRSDAHGPENIEALLAQAQEERASAERALARASRRFDVRQSSRRAGFEEVARGLRDGEALVAFARYERGASGPGRSRTGGGAAYVAFVLPRPAAAPDVIPLGDAEAIDTAADRWRHEREIARVARGGGAGGAGVSLRELVWDPISTKLRGARRIFVVLDGSILTVNLDALPRRGGGYLIEEPHVLQYLSAERELAVRETYPGGEGLLAVGGVSFGEGRGREPQPNLATRTECLMPGDVQWEDLPSSLEEARMAERAWQKAPPSFAGGRPRLLGGVDASEEAFKALAPGRRALHLATHGFYLARGCAELPGAGDGRRGLAAVGTARAHAARGSRPLSLSGLVFAHANDDPSASSGGEDGVLLAEEIAAMDLQGVEWAVLSACDSGSGERRAGEGILGLRRAFEIAGVRTLVVSLWPVEDSVAREWMEAFYASVLGDGDGIPEGVRKAGLAVLTERRAAGRSQDPVHWAPFVAVGGQKPRGGG